MRRGGSAAPFVISPPPLRLVSGGVCLGCDSAFGDDFACKEHYVPQNHGGPLARSG